MVPRNLIVVFSLLSLAAGCGSDDKYYIPADHPIKPFQEPEREELVSEEDDAWEDLDFEEADAEGDEADEEEGEGEPAEEAAGAAGEEASGEGPKSAPKIEIGKATAKGGLDKNIIRRYIRRKLPRFRSCYERRLVKNPKLAGKVTTRFTIGADGKVAKAEATGFPDKNVSDCVAVTIRSIVFPKPKGGGSVEVTYPFVFTSS